MTEDELLAFLNANRIQYQRFDHPAVYTCKQASIYTNNKPGARTKNLFLRDQKSERFYLLATLEDKRIDFNQLARLLGIGKNIRFGSAEQLLALLGIEPGSVTLLSLVNDTNGCVNLLIDQDLWKQPSWQCHPMVNTATLVIHREDMLRFFALTRHTAQVIEVPVKISAEK